GEGQPPVHGERACDVESERVLQVVEGEVEAIGLELEPGEVDRGLVLGGVLVEVGDVRAVPEKEAGDGGDDSGTIRALDEKDGAWRVDGMPTLVRTGSFCHEQVRCEHGESVEPGPCRLSQDPSDQG